MRIGSVVVAFVLLGLSALAAEPRVQLGSLFDDGAVLQREAKVPVWGTAAPGTEVTVTFDARPGSAQTGQKKTARAGDGGRWQVALDPMPASAEGRTLTVQADGARREVKDVLVGEVWVASGQSNMAVQSRPIEPRSWADLREAQRATLAVPNTGMAVITDIGEARDIHPRNKQDVGRRLALIALAQTYGQQTEFSGPIFAGLEIAGDQAIVTFSHAEGLTAGDGPVLGFAIAGEDKVFHRADARVDGQTVALSSAGVPAPVAVRYNWANNPVGTLRNAAGLPASCFRTDEWTATEVKAAAELAVPPAQ